MRISLGCMDTFMIKTMSMLSMNSVQMEIYSIMSKNTQISQKTRLLMYVFAIIITR